MICDKCKNLLEKNGVKQNKTMSCSHIISDNKIYEALMVEKETRQKFKKIKESSVNPLKFATNTQFLEYLLELHLLKVL